MASAARVMRPMDYENDAPRRFGGEVSKLFADLWDEQRPRWDFATVNRRPPLNTAIHDAFAATKQEYVTLRYLAKKTGHDQNHIADFLDANPDYRRSAICGSEGQPLYMRNIRFAALKDFWRFFTATNYWAG